MYYNKTPKEAEEDIMEFPCMVSWKRETGHRFPRRIDAQRTKWVDQALAKYKTWIELARVSFMLMKW